jgi:hypothetical protein
MFQKIAAFYFPDSVLLSSWRICGFNFCNHSPNMMLLKEAVINQPRAASIFLSDRFPRMQLLVMVGRFRWIRTLSLTSLAACLPKCRVKRHFSCPINTTKGTNMKICEIIANVPQNNRLQPSMVKQQARVGKVVAQIAASDQKQQPTEMDKVMAMRSYATMKKQNDKLYAQRLRQQLASAEKAVQ